MLRIGLTGGIGSGKSVVAELFARRGVPIVDADEIARHLVAPGLPATNELARTFAGVVSPEGHVNRAALRRLVFADPAKRKQLEAILHPRVRDAIQERTAQLHAPYAILVIPLLVESGMRDLVDRVLAVDCDEQTQIDRVMARSGLEESQVRQIMAAQVSRSERLAHADDVLKNDAGRDHVEREVARLHALYVDLARTSDVKPR